MASYIIRDIDQDLWRKVKSKAALEGTSVKQSIEDLLRDWVKTPAKKPKD